MAIMLRLKCPSCGEVMNAAGFCNCTKCGTPICYNGWGMLQIYRMGSPVSIAAGWHLSGRPALRPSGQQGEHPHSAPDGDAHAAHDLRHDAPL